MEMLKSFICIALLVHVGSGCKDVSTSRLKESAEDSCRAQARTLKFIEFAISPIAFIPQSAAILSPLKTFIEMNSPNCTDLTFARWMQETKIVLSDMNTQFMDFAESYYSNFEVTEGAALQSPIDTLEDNIQVLDQARGLSKVAASTRDALTVVKNKLDAQTVIVSRNNAKIPEVITAYTLGMELGAVAVGQGKVFENRYTRFRFKDINEKILIHQVKAKSSALRLSYKALINALIAKRNAPNYGAKIVPVLSPSPFYKTKEVNERDCSVFADSAVMLWQGSELNVNFGGQVTYHLEALGAIASRTDLKANLEGQTLRVQFNSGKQGICTWDALNNIVEQNAAEQLSNYYSTGIPDAVSSRSAFDQASSIVDINVLNHALKAVQ
ncbi:MAG: hypothetical protein H7249_00460 [Chitinophagaceae bacterium]|nr:hypothetical protein [Oligoflexus sp.]